MNKVQIFMKMVDEWISRYSGVSGLRKMIG